MNARMDALRARLGGFGFGGDGVFARASLEPEPGHFTFDWLDDAMDLAVRVTRTQ